MEKAIVLIPTYNEIGNIGRIIDKVMELRPAFHVLVIDDGSPDGTADLVKSKFQEYPGRLFIEERSGKLGLGTAYIHGFRWALERDFEYIIEMDADFSHPVSALPALRAACADGKAQVSVGSRYVKDGGVKDWPLGRIILSYGASVYVRMVTWMPVKDTTAGFVCYRRKVLQEIDLDKIRFVGYAFQIEMKFAAWQLGHKITEVPITFIDRTVGESKMSMSIFQEAIFGVLSMRFWSFGNSYRKT